MFAGIYYSAASPAEMVNVRDTDCTLPDKDWGEPTLWESRPLAGPGVPVVGLRAARAGPVRTGRRREEVAGLVPDPDPAAVPNTDGARLISSTVLGRDGRVVAMHREQIDATLAAQLVAKQFP